MKLPADIKYFSAEMWPNPMIPLQRAQSKRKKHEVFAGGFKPLP
jgi:hypothetical protein